MFGPVRPTTTAPTSADLLGSPVIGVGPANTGIPKPMAEPTTQAHSGAPGYSQPTPTPSNSYNEIAAAEAKQRKAQGRLATIYTSNYGIAPNSQVSLARKMLTGV